MPTTVSVPASDHPADQFTERLREVLRDAYAAGRRDAIRELAASINVHVPAPRAVVAREDGKRACRANKAEILAWMGDRAVSRREIAENFGISYGAADAHMHQLKAAGRVRRVSRGLFAAVEG